LTEETLARLSKINNEFKCFHYPQIIYIYTLCICIHASYFISLEYQGTRSQDESTPGLKKHFQENDAEVHLMGWWGTNSQGKVFTPQENLSLR